MGERRAGLRFEAVVTHERIEPTSLPYTLLPYQLPILMLRSQHARPRSNMSSALLYCSPSNPFRSFVSSFYPQLFKFSQTLHDFDLAQSRARAKLPKHWQPDDRTALNDCREYLPQLLLFNINNIFACPSILSTDLSQFLSTAIILFGIATIKQPKLPLVHSL